MISDDPIPPAALRQALDELVESGAIKTSSRSRGQTWLARQVGVSPRTVRRWCSGERALQGGSATAVRMVIEGARQ